MVHANYRTPPPLGTKIEQLLEKGLWALRETPGWETLVGQPKSRAGPWRRSRLWRPQ